MINTECPMIKWGGEEDQVRAGMADLGVGSSLLEIGHSSV